MWTVKILSMDTLKLMPIGQPPPPFETGSVCSQAGLELSILLPQIACPLPLSYFVCMYIWTQCVGGRGHTRRLPWPACGGWRTPLEPVLPSHFYVCS